MDESRLVRYIRARITHYVDSVYLLYVPVAIEQLIKCEPGLLYSKLLVNRLVKGYLAVRAMKGHYAESSPNSSSLLDPSRHWFW